MVRSQPRPLPPARPSPQTPHALCVRPCSVPWANLSTVVETGYPAHWEADVLLADGRAAHLRPITVDDAEGLVRFYERVSPESKYLRFFAPYPTLSERDVFKFTHIDH